MVTFYLPLFMKAIEIALSDTTVRLKDVVARLGGFHLLMASMDVIGNIMVGIGLDDLRAQVYARASVSSMMGGHAYSRALRAHFLTAAAIAIILLNKSTDLDPFIVYSLAPSYSSAVAVRHVLDGAYLLHVVQWPVRTGINKCTMYYQCRKF